MDAPARGGDDVLSIVSTQFHRPGAYAYVLTVPGVTGPDTSDVREDAFARATGSPTANATVHFVDTVLMPKA
ncbi:hypothetical protein [Streptomyces cyaneofuscatus]|uniref:hypothetical protein n=1 Tax=Streptomyces cyaneofuscatus TaxID=66883 RepID=UPI00331B38DE